MWPPVKTPLAPLQHHGRVFKIKPYYDSSYQIYVDIKDKLQQSYGLVNMGYYYSGIGNFKEAEKNS